MNRVTTFHFFQKMCQTTVSLGHTSYSMSLQADIPCVTVYSHLKASLNRGDPINCPQPPWPEDLPSFIACSMTASRWCWRRWRRAGRGPVTGRPRPGRGCGWPGDTTRVSWAWARVLGWHSPPSPRARPSCALWGLLSHSPRRTHSPTTKYRHVFGNWQYYGNACNWCFYTFASEKEQFPTVTVHPIYAFRFLKLCDVNTTLPF